MEVWRSGICSIWWDYMLKWDRTAGSASDFLTSASKKKMRIRTLFQFRWNNYSYPVLPPCFTRLCECQTEPHRKKLVVLEYWCRFFCLIINFMCLLSTGEVVSFRIYIFKMKCILEINYDWMVILCFSFIQIWVQFWVSAKKCQAYLTIWVFHCN